MRMDSTARKRGQGFVERDFQSTPVLGVKPYPVTPHVRYLLGEIR